jgi:hypothetical protein
VLARIILYSTMFKHVVVMRRYALRAGKKELVGESSNIKIEPEASASKVRPQHAPPPSLCIQMFPVDALKYSHLIMQRPCRNAQAEMRMFLFIRCKLVSLDVDHGRVTSMLQLMRVGDYR